MGGLDDAGAAVAGSIASPPALSANTVRNLLVETRRKLDAANCAELVRVAVLR